MVEAKVIKAYLDFEGFNLNRISEQLIQQLCANEGHVIEAMKIVEGFSENSKMKPAADFSRAPLRGYSHIHYEHVENSGKNIELELKRDKSLKTILKDARKNDDPRIQAEEIAKKVTSKYWTRGDEGRRTGHWLIFKKETGHNYFLMTCEHVVGRPAQELLKTDLDEIWSSLTASKTDG